MEHAIGEIVTLPDGRKAQVVEVDRMLQCSSCALWAVIGCQIQVVRCIYFERADGKNIIYKEIEEE